MSEIKLTIEQQLTLKLFSANERIAELEQQLEQQKGYTKVYKREAKELEQQLSYKNIQIADLVEMVEVLEGQVK